MVGPLSSPNFPQIGRQSWRRAAAAAGRQVAALGGRDLGLINFSPRLGPSMVIFKQLKYSNYTHYALN